ncbi:hypothetical protein LZ30DRAFT_700899 [Colletotrichum cereale]|nr:hypothetical protein LZ30DRAFT_700899 [Colletotrichum cereale]
MHRCPPPRLSQVSPYEIRRVRPTSPAMDGARFHHQTLTRSQAPRSESLKRQCQVTENDPKAAASRFPSRPHNPSVLIAVNHADPRGTALDTNLGRLCGFMALMHPVSSPASPAPMCLKRSNVGTRHNSTRLSLPSPLLHVRRASSYEALLLVRPSPAQWPQMRGGLSSGSSPAADKATETLPPFPPQSSSVVPGHLSKRGIVAQRNILPGLLGLLTGSRNEKAISHQGAAGGQRATRSAFRENDTRLRTHAVWFWLRLVTSPHLRTRPRANCKFHWNVGMCPTAFSPLPCYIPAAGPLLSPSSWHTKNERQKRAPVADSK